ncbi:MAG: hypothetical protein GYB19_10185 [Rhodospirillales bacterium]|nr:hypothetical protein [Rhodospirillales bacterium]
MTNTTLTASIIAKEAVRVLDNELVMAKKVFRGYEDDINKKVNGYEVGDTLTIRKPADFTVRDGATASAQNVTEGKTTITVDKRKGIDFKFTSQELTLDIKELSDRVIKPAMVQLANQVDVDLHALYADVPNWVGTPGQTVDSFADFAKAPERLDEGAVPQDMRCSVLAPADHWGLVGSQTALYTDTIAKPAYRKGTVGMIGNVDTYMTQNVATHTTGAFAGTVKVDASITTSTISYADVKDTNTQTVHIDGLTTATATIKKGDVFTIAGVYDVNPVTKAPLAHLKMFTVTADATAASNEVDLVVSPAMVWTGAHKNVDVQGVSDLNNQDVTFMGSQSTNYRQNMVFHRNAFGLVSVPLISPPGATDVGRQTYNGTSVRVIPVYDGISDESMWRLDLLYGVKAIDPRLATRLSGTA